MKIYNINNLFKKYINYLYIKNYFQILNLNKFNKIIKYVFNNIFK